MTDRYRQWATTPNTERPRLSVIIPTHNEEWRILPTIGAIATFVSSLGHPWELIVSDDGSTDRTVEIVRERELVNVQVLEVPQNTGKGGAVRRGVVQARGDFVLFADADQATPIEQLPEFLDAIDGGADIAIGSRGAGGASVQNKSVGRRVLSAGLLAFTRSVFRLSVSDTQCGFKLFDGDVARQLFSTQRIDGFSFDVELLYIARRNGLHVVEIPVEWYDAPGSTVNSGRDTLRFIRDMPSILWNGFSGAYTLRPGIEPPAIVDVDDSSGDDGQTRPSRPAVRSRRESGVRRRQPTKIGVNK